MTTEHECFTFPMYHIHDDSMDIVRVKMRAIETKKHMRLHPVGGGWGLFGLQTIDKTAKEVVITEGEFDAMAVRQATGLSNLFGRKFLNASHIISSSWYLYRVGVAAVSLPNGASSLPPAVLPALERFTVVYLWMD
eukprot:SAG31_NODE_6957_length_1835_cov_1.206221_1_plen_135_part_10